MNFFAENQAVLSEFPGDFFNLVNFLIFSSILASQDALMYYKTPQFSVAFNACSALRYEVMIFG